MKADFMTIWCVTGDHILNAKAGTYNNNNNNNNNKTQETQVILIFLHFSVPHPSQTHPDAARTDLHIFLSFSYLFMSVAG
jgi:hypothetical protein